MPTVGGIAVSGNPASDDLRIVGMQLTKEFLRLQSHFLFESHFCRVRRANEKGHVENLVGFTRRNFLVPVPKAASLQELNDRLHQRCGQDLDRQRRGSRFSAPQ